MTREASSAGLGGPWMLEVVVVVEVGYCLVEVVVVVVLTWAGRGVVWTLLKAGSGNDGDDDGLVVVDMGLTWARCDDIWTLLVAEVLHVVLRT